MQFHETVFLGGGVSCLAAAREHKGDHLLLEREERVGGLCRSDAVFGFIFDRTGHLLHMQNPRVKAWLLPLLGKTLNTCERDSWVYSNGRYTRYPFQSHFFGLPPAVAAECLEGVFAAHYRRRRKRAPRRFSDWVLHAFGEGVARHFMFPYNRKLWTVPPEQLTTEWLGRFVPTPDLREVVLGALFDRAPQEGYNARFFYPRRGGIERLVEALAWRQERIVTGVGVEGIDLKRRRLRLSDGSRLQFGRLVSCAPLPVLVRMTKGVPDVVRAAARRLRCASVFNLNLGIRDRGETRHWVYVPSDRFAIYRFGFASNFSRCMAPSGMANVYTELSYRGQRPDPRALRRRVLRDLSAIGIIRSPDDVVVSAEFDIRYGYPIYDAHRKAAVAAIRRFFEHREIFPIGRYGRWEYSSMEDAILQGISLFK
jgi:protoporphyrinogen oxidase